VSNHVVHYQTGNRTPVASPPTDAGSFTTWKTIALCGKEAPRRSSSDSTLVTCPRCIERLARRTEKALKAAEENRAVNPRRPMLLMPKGSGRLIRPKGHGRR